MGAPLTLSAPFGHAEKHHEAIYPACTDMAISMQVHALTPTHVHTLIHKSTSAGRTISHKAHHGRLENGAALSAPGFALVEGGCTAAGVAANSELGFTVGPTSGRCGFPKLKCRVTLYVCIKRPGHLLCGTSCANHEQIMST